MVNRIFKLAFPLFLISQLFTFSCQSQSRDEISPVLTGLDHVHNYHSLFINKNIGIVTNHTAVNRDGEHITDIFLNMPDVTVTALFGPEHGVRGFAAAGEKVDSQIDPLSNIPIYSLYGKTKKPSADMLKNVDVLVFDIQDIGARFYTYIWTMFYALQAANENDIRFVVLDRPNPITQKIEGPILEKEFSSFVGLQSIPVRHGMTVGELAKLFYGEGWIGEPKTELIVVPLKRWQRDMWFDDTGLHFVAPSPNMPNLETAIMYPGTCLLEGTNVSEGRGTDSPFLLLGAPWINAKELSEKLNVSAMPGIQFDPAEFTPISIPGKSLHPKYENEKCFGVKINIINRDELAAFDIGIRIIKTMHDSYPDKFKFQHNGFFDKLCGTDSIRIAIENAKNLTSIQKIGKGEQEAFMLMRKKYLLYSK